MQSEMEHRVQSRKQSSGQVESLGVEFEPFDKAAPGRIDPIRLRWPRGIRLVRGEVPATFWNGTSRVLSSGDIFPERGQIGRAGKDPADAYDGDPFRTVISRHLGSEAYLTAIAADFIQSLVRALVKSQDRAHIAHHSQPQLRTPTTLLQSVSKRILTIGRTVQVGTRGGPMPD